MSMRRRGSCNRGCVFERRKSTRVSFFIPLQCQFPFGFASFLISILAVTCKSANMESLSAILFKFLSCSVKVDERSGSKICPQEKWPV